MNEHVASKPASAPGTVQLPQAVPLLRGWSAGSSSAFSAAVLLGGQSARGSRGLLAGRDRGLASERSARPRRRAVAARCSAWDRIRRRNVASGDSAHRAAAVPRSSSSRSRRWSAAASRWRGRWWHSDRNLDCGSRRWTVAAPSMKRSSARSRRPVRRARLRRREEEALARRHRGGRRPGIPRGRRASEAPASRGSSSSSTKANSSRIGSDGLRCVARRQRGRNDSSASGAPGARWPPTRRRRPDALVAVGGAPSRPRGRLADSGGDTPQRSCPSMPRVALMPAADDVRTVTSPRLPRTDDTADDLRRRMRAENGRAEQRADAAARPAAHEPRARVERLMTPEHYERRSPAPSRAHPRRRVDQACGPAQRRCRPPRRGRAARRRRRARRAARGVPACFTSTWAAGAPRPRRQPGAVLRREGLSCRTGPRGSARAARPSVDDHLGERLAQSGQGQLRERLVIRRRFQRTLRPHALGGTPPARSQCRQVANIQHSRRPGEREASSPRQARGGRSLEGMTAQDARTRWEDDTRDGGLPIDHGVEAGTAAAYAEVPSDRDRKKKRTPNGMCGTALACGGRAAQV